MRISSRRGFTSVGPPPVRVRQPGRSILLLSKLGQLYTCQTKTVKLLKAKGRRIAPVFGLV